MIGNTPLYSDTNHLSEAGALLYAPLFEPYLANLAQRLALRPAAGAAAPADVRNN